MLEYCSASTRLLHALVKWTVQRTNDKARVYQLIQQQFDPVNRLFPTVADFLIPGEFRPSSFFSITLTSILYTFYSELRHVIRAPFSSPERDCSPTPSSSRSRSCC
jgi:hypothetical protein